VYQRGVKAAASREKKQMAKSKRERLLKELEDLQEELREREAALPAHSVRPHQLQEIEKLEDRIAALERMLEEITS
jgi:hypothetical protein